jgi:hypothetical protein
MEVKLTVLFEDPFWVGVFEVSYDSKYSVCKYLFGSEPKDNEVYEMILKQYGSLHFSKPVNEVDNIHKKVKKINPKRMHRMIKKEMKDSGIGTKAQNAIKAEREANKIERKTVSKIRKQECKQLQFQRKQEKKKQKKRGH